MGQNYDINHISTCKIKQEPKVPKSVVYNECNFFIFINKNPEIWFIAFNQKTIEKRRQKYGTWVNNT